MSLPASDQRKVEEPVGRSAGHLGSNQRQQSKFTHEDGNNENNDDNKNNNSIIDCKTITKMQAGDKMDRQPPVEKKRHDSPDSACGSTSTALVDDDNGRASKTGSCTESIMSPATATTVTFFEYQPEAPDKGQENCKTSGSKMATGNTKTTAARLLYESREPLKLKDFSEEIRGAMDVEQSVCQSELLLDLRESSIEGIVAAMLREVVENEPKRKGNNYQLGDLAAQVASEIFVPGSTTLMAQTIQGVRPEPQVAGQNLEADQSWLCALCRSAQIKRRHMAIARFKDPINMGAQAHEVRLFVLILTPAETKGTKGPLETGRTFATLLADARFRSKLLAAREPTEFKSLMVLEAQQLRQSYQSGSGASYASELPKFKNRHKYLFDAALHMSMTALTSSSSSSSSSGGCKVDPNNNNNSSKTNTTTADATAASLRSESSYDISNSSVDNLPVTTFDENPRTNQLLELIIAGGASGKGKSNPSKQQQQLQNGANYNESTNRLDFCPVPNGTKSSSYPADQKKPREAKSICSHIEFGKGLWQDLCRRLRFYPSDFLDGFVGPPRTIQKTVATIWFLYFGILLPTIAFSSLNTHQTHGHMGDLRKAIIGQAIGGLGFALFGGQPLVIIMTTAPLCLYTKVIHQMCIDYGYHFPAMYAAVGIWNGVFLTIYSLFGFSKLMRWCTRSTEEIFALFIVIAFISDAGKDLVKNFKKNYYSEACESALPSANSTLATNGLALDPSIEKSVCRRETSLLFTLLMLGTLWLSTSLYKFNKTPYLSPGKRQLLADYALPTAVIIMSFFGSFIFSEIYVEKFPPIQELRFERAQVELLPVSGVLVSLGLGFTLSLLFFMDQNISAAMVNAPQNRLKKGCAYHYDLLVVGILNGFLASFGLPMMHGVLPHSPLHVLSLSDIEERFEEGHLKQVVTNCRETRVTSVVAHLLLAASLLLIPYPIAYIPRAVLDGLFLFMAVSSLDGLQIFERILLFITEQNKYPPNHYIRRCPQRKIHLFTGIQLIQLLVMCLFGFSPINVVEMFFPVIILLMIPFRHKIVPKYVGKRYLEALDGKHS